MRYDYSNVNRPAARHSGKDWREGREQERREKKSMRGRRPVRSKVRCRGEKWRKRRKREDDDDEDEDEEDDMRS